MYLDNPLEYVEIEIVVTDGNSKMLDNEGHSRK